MCVLSTIMLLLWFYSHSLLSPYHSVDQQTLSEPSITAKPILPTDRHLFAQTLHSQCRSTYLQNASDRQHDIGDIHLDANSRPSLQFLTFSDYGIFKPQHSHNKHMQPLLQLMHTMNEHLKHGAHFVISGGDHFYENDVNTARHSRWNVYNNFVSDTVFLSTVGNIDWLDTHNKVAVEQVKAQLDRTYWSSNWCLPALFYTVRFVFWRNELREFSVRLITLDTTAYLHDYAHEEFAYLSRQYEWLEAVLDANHKDEWIVMYAHHPFETVVGNKPDENASSDERRKLQNGPRYGMEDLERTQVCKPKMLRLLQLLRKYENVRLYISGHHHIWRVCHIHQHEQVKLVTMVTGSTGKSDHYFNKKLPVHMVAGGDDVSFGKVTVDKEKMRVEIIGKDNQTLFDEIYMKYNV